MLTGPFRGFFDEANKHSPESDLILAGLTNSVEAWEVFSEGWHKCLIAPPKINYFKGSEATQLAGQFLRMSSLDRDKKKLALARVVADSKPRAYIAIADHATLKGKPKQLKKMMGMRLYDWAFIAMASTVVVDRADRKDFGKIDFIFDRCSELRACIESYEKQREQWPPTLRRIAGEVIPGDDHELTGLQAADLIAGEYAVLQSSGKKTDTYAFLEASGLAIRAFKAEPPADYLNMVIGYAREVHERAALVHEMIRLLKKAGVNLDDFKE